MPETNLTPSSPPRPDKNVTEPSASPKKEAQILAFVNQKGGTGKTTIALNLAACLAAQHQQRVLCIDLDPQGNLTHGLTGQTGGFVKYADRMLLVPAPKISEYIIQTQAGVDLVPNQFHGELHDNIERLPLRANLLRNIIAEVRSRYDFVVIDSPAGLCRATQIGVDAADQVMIVVSCGSYALKGASNLVAWVGEINRTLNKPAPKVRVVLNNYDGRRRFDREIKQEAETIFGEGVYQTHISASVRIAEAAARSTPVIQHAPISSSAVDFHHLSCEVMGLPLSIAAKVMLSAGNKSEPAPEKEPETTAAEPVRLRLVV
jgi:chromosome partitioning protein